MNENDTKILDEWCEELERWVNDHDSMAGRRYPSYLTRAARAKALRHALDFLHDSGEPHDYRSDCVCRACRRVGR